MLRITREGDAASQTLRLEGRLTGAWVDVLRKAWDEAVAPSGGIKLTLDLGDLSFADRDGRALLRELQRSGAVLTGVSEFMRHILAESSRDSDGKGE